MPARSAVYLSIIGLMPTCYRAVLRAMYLNRNWDDETAIANMRKLLESVKVGQ